MSSGATVLTQFSFFFFLQNFEATHTGPGECTHSSGSRYMSCLPAKPRLFTHSRDQLLKRDQQGDNLLLFFLIARCNR